MSKKRQDNIISNFLWSDIRVIFYDTLKKNVDDDLRMKLYDDIHVSIYTQVHTQILIPIRTDIIFKPYFKTNERD